eukprot:7072694-Pyramimonas_sp.AAC.1
MLFPSLPLPLLPSALDGHSKPLVTAAAFAAQLSLTEGGGVCEERGAGGRPRIARASDHFRFGL